MNNYEYAKAKYATLGIDTDAAMELLKDVPVAIHCWQGDDVVGFDSKEALCAHLRGMKEFYSDRSVLIQEYLDIEKEYDICGVCLDREVIIPAVIEKTRREEYGKCYRI